MKLAFIKAMSHESLSRFVVRSRRRKQQLEQELELLNAELPVAERELRCRIAAASDHRNKEAA
jgi:hypothetical protein